MAYVAQFKDWVAHQAEVEQDQAEQAAQQAEAEAACKSAAAACSVSGLGQGLTATANPFTVDCTPDAGRSDPGFLDLLNVKVAGPKEAHVTTDLNPDGVFGCTYTTDAPGDYTVTVTLRGQPVSGSPATVNVKESLDPSKCYAGGDGVTDGQVLDNAPTEFLVVTCYPDGTQLETGGVNVETSVKCLSDPSHNPNVAVQDNGDGTYGVKYTADLPGQYEISVLAAGQHISESPFTVNVPQALEPSKCYAGGDGVTDGKVLDNAPTDFLVVTCLADGTQLEKGGVDVEANIKCISDPSHNPEAAVKDNGDGTYNVHYEVDMPGQYEISVLAAGAHINESPYTVNVKQGVQPENVSGHFTYTVQAKDHRGEKITHGGSDWQVIIRGPEDADIQVHTQDLGDGRYTAEYELVAHHENDSAFKVECRLDGHLVG
eukprot:315852_1